MRVLVLIVVGSIFINAMCMLPRRPCVEARIPVPDVRFNWLAETYKSNNRIPAFLTCIDIAGLTAVRRHFHCFIPTLTEETIF